MRESAIQSYAPTIYMGESSGGKRSGLDQEIKLHITTKQRELYESLAEIHAIIVTLDFLEKAFLRDSISHTQYTPTCLRLIAQYNGVLKNDTVLNEFGSLERFRKRYSLEYQLGIARLQIGIPVTVEQAMIGSTEKAEQVTPKEGFPGIVESSPGPIKGGAKAIAKVTGNFITCMDAVKLNYKAKDQLHPLLSELMTNLNKVTMEGHEFSGRGKLVQWLIRLNGLKADEEINDEQARQLLFDLDSAYKEFYTSLE